MAADTKPRAETKFGIVYNGWHCLVTGEGKPAPHNIAEALSGRRPWGPIPEFHYWAEPADGYYCLGERPDLLRRHAEELREAGIDFIVFDATNNPFADARTPDSQRGVMEPFQRLVEVWSQVPGAPKVVPWAPLTSDGTMFEWMLDRLKAQPGLFFSLNGKPLALVTEAAQTFHTDSDKEKALSRSYTIRRMWGLSNESKNWSFLSPCQRGFLATQARIPCRQKHAVRDGTPEQISIAVAYQETYASYKATAVPKFQGRTFIRQFETLASLPKVQVALISGWNEWMAQRFCLSSPTQVTWENCTVDNDHWPDGTKVFVDDYDVEYSRDIEPSKEWPYDFYLRLMSHCIRKFREGGMCAEGEVRLPPRTR